MNNDSGSEISFERQSSGRYSFKIPRPFATYDTTPADNLSFHNRSFKEDETHRLREDELKSLNGTLAKFYFDDIDYKPHEEYRPHENGKWNFVFRGTLKLRDYIYSLMELKCKNGANEYHECYWVLVLIDLVTFVYIYSSFWIFYWNLTFLSNSLLLITTGL